MTTPDHHPRSDSLASWHRIFAALLAVAMIGLAGCGGTKVYTAEKTMIYKGSMYNLSSTQQVGSRIDGNLADGTTADMRRLDKKGVEALLKANPGMMVTTLVLMDDTEMVYERKAVKKYSEYSKMASRLDGALKDISKFMASAKKTQLKL